MELGSLGYFFQWLVLKLVTSHDIIHLFVKSIES